MRVLPRPSVMNLTLDKGLMGFLPVISFDVSTRPDTFGTRNNAQKFGTPQ